MARIVLKQVKKVYPNTETPAERQKKRRFGAEKEPAAPAPTVSSEGVVAVRDSDLEIADGEFVVLVGPSGCGKSTTLRMIAGLEEITDGEIWIGDRLVNRVPPKDRNIAMVFQNYALFPHMTVYDNMGFALRMQKVSRAEIDRRVREAAEILDITEYLKRKPRALSGGQRQRVAIGRAIVCDPQVFLMDEPLSNLDAKLRNQMRAELIQLRRRVNTTFVYVTHDQTEAMTLGDRIVIMKDGLIQQVGTPREVFEHPKNLFVAGFIGLPPMNVFPGCRIARDEARYYVEIKGARIPLPEDKQRLAAEQSLEGRTVSVGLRPVHTLLGTEGLPAVVEVTELLGSEQYVHLNALGDEVIAVVPADGEQADRFSPGKQVCLTLPPDYLHIFDDESEENLF